MVDDNANVLTDFARVYATGETPPPHPGDQWTRLVCVSDTHSRKFQVPDGDVLIHAGDLSSRGHIPKQLQFTIDWIESLPHPIKILIAGNHDLLLDTELVRTGEVTEEDSKPFREHLRSQKLKDAGIHYLEYESLSITAGPGKRLWKLWGSPATAFYSEGAFQYVTSGEATEIYDAIPLDTEILITHTPPYKILDKTTKGVHAGCRPLRKRLDLLEQLHLHVFGHIHEAHGAMVDTDWDQTLVYVNAAMGSVSKRRQAIVVDLKN